jgi:chorismate mutase / prephenate dehydratase
MALEDIRKDIDEIDEQLLALFLRRMDCARRVAEAKKGSGTPIFNEKREREILDSVSEKAGEFGGDARLLFSDLMAISRAEQHRLLGGGEPLRRAVQEAGTALEAPKKVACLGQKGSYSHEALLRLYPGAEPLFFPDFASIFAAVQSGDADLGVAPVENSLAGSVEEVYGLILKYRFSIVQALSLPIWHCLASSETDLAGIKTVYSQPQALSQCSEFLKAHSLHTEPFSSTAEAALEARKPGVAAVCSHPAAAECGLHVLADGIQNNSANRTRFITVSRRLVIPENAHKISLCFSVPHRTGTLSSVLSRFSAAGLSLTKIESRPIPGKNFEYDFYLDFTGNIREAHTLDLLCALHDELLRFSFLGNYAEEE